MNERRTVHARVVFIGIFALLALAATTAVAVLTESEGVVATLAGLTGMALGGLLGAPRATGGMTDAEVVERFNAITTRLQVPAPPVPAPVESPPVELQRIPSQPEWSERRTQPDLVTELLQNGA